MTYRSNLEIGTLMGKTLSAVTRDNEAEDNGDRILFHTSGDGAAVYAMYYEPD